MDVCKRPGCSKPKTECGFCLTCSNKIDAGKCVYCSKKRSRGKLDGACQPCRAMVTELKHATKNRSSFVQVMNNLNQNNIPPKDCYLDSKDLYIKIRHNSNDSTIDIIDY